MISELFVKKWEITCIDVRGSFQSDFFHCNGWLYLFFWLKPIIVKIYIFARSKTTSYCSTKARKGQAERFVQLADDKAFTWRAQREWLRKSSWRLPKAYRYCSCRILEGVYTCSASAKANFIKSQLFATKVQQLETFRAAAQVLHVHQ